MHVKPKKHLGQHFLRDRNIAASIVDSLSFHGNYESILEIGPGTGILTDILFDKYPGKTWIIDIDEESIRYIKDKYPGKEDRIIHGDFLKMNLAGHI
jgi:16S rRNA (adenine1518-N6/adenine1519-N6)-dimethyltransferase